MHSRFKLTNPDAANQSASGPELQSNKVYLPHLGSLIWVTFAARLINAIRYTQTHSMMTR